MTTHDSIGIALFVVRMRVHNDNIGKFSSTLRVDHISEETLYVSCLDSIVFVAQSPASSFSS